MDNILALHRDLKNKSYQHGGYYHFRISDPKPRDIHKASVRDRLLHHAIHRILYPSFDKKFIADSYSCRVNKGSHKAINRFRSFAYKVSKNHTRTCWVLKCDIRKFFASVSHEKLTEILNKQIKCKDTLWLLNNIIFSFKTTTQIGVILHSSTMLKHSGAVELPLGNLTSQLLVNIYMNEFDQFVKHKLKEKYYIRYADDFVFLSEDREHLENLIPQIQEFLKNSLHLDLHPKKLFIETFASGVDFLGWVNFADHRVLRSTTKKRMIRKLAEYQNIATRQSYLGLLKHGNTQKIRKSIRKSETNSSCGC